MPDLRPQQNAPSSHSYSGGFALVIALSLMAFILLLLMSLTAVVRVETQSSKIQTEISLARSNALLGLQIAIGDLQKTAGPDQRVSATADLSGRPPLDTQQHWTGVWDVSNQDPFTTHSTPPLLQWLVSGLDTSGAKLQPNSVVNDPVTLIENSIVPENSVIAGRVPLQSVDAVTNGHYAFWIGDEGVKAKINTIDPHHDGNSTESFFSQLSAQRFGIEAISSSESGDDLGALISPLEPLTAHTLKRLQSGQEFSFLHTDLEALQANRIHDITTYSYGLLTDTQNGGLKKDLSLAFEMDLSDFNRYRHFRR
ncbi:hypothetical protein SH580_03320 [Coraliomargarita algicola]|uniref:Type 4 fimbrial biogenesis protein PilX N-terminal domain-containing protein n=1 Tax=Coraliomargarita algicola TaxID=3092156 RepID=A0ABZ0RKJ7_9BACT|nr:hypothetical protein [Coraliomargarita sp. J2-16]WPJ96734.1 hypothetical protein SH580_03320 [Coraliomargarita sp. J2-16]